MTDWTTRPAVRALVERDGCHLFLRSEWSGGAKWVLPGGGVEPREAPRDALRRELHEETGLDPEIGRPVGCFAFSSESRGVHVVNTVFAATATGTVDVTENADDEPLVDHDWFAPGERPDALPPEVGSFLDRYDEAERSSRTSSA